LTIQAKDLGEQIVLFHSFQFYVVDQIQFRHSRQTCRSFLVTKVTYDNSHRDQCTTQHAWHQIHKSAAYSGAKML